jgi:hypothetical protein
MITSWRDIATETDLMVFPMEFAEILDLLEELNPLESISDKYLYLSYLLRLGQEGRNNRERIYYYRREYFSQLRLN